MKYSIHTFEITLILSKKEKYDQLYKKAFKKAKDSHKVFEEKGVLKDKSFSKKGIDIEYHGDFRRKNFKKKIKFIVNPSRVLGGDDLDLWKPNKGNISELIEKLEEYIEDYFDSEYELKDFTLCRVDFTINIDVGSKKYVSAYIAVLRNIGKVKGFSQKYNNENLDWYNKDLSFDLEGNSNGVELTAYDKQGALEQKDKKDPDRIAAARGILRIEIRLTKAKAIRKHTKETNTVKQIKDLSIHSKETFLEYFTQVIPYGDFYKKKEAEEIIENSNIKKAHQKKMLKLIELIPKKKSLLLAKREMNDRNIDKIMDKFSELNLSPVTISKRSKVKKLQNLYNYLLQ